MYTDTSSLQSKTLIGVSKYKVLFLVYECKIICLYVQNLGIFTTCKTLIHLCTEKKKNTLPSLGHTQFVLYITIE